MVEYPAQAFGPVIHAQEPTGALFLGEVGPFPFTQADFGSAEDVELIDARPPVVVETWPAEEALKVGGTFEFFEHFHVVPRAFDFGNLLSDQSVPIEVFSGYRRTTRTWSAFDNDAGSGVTLGGQPLLPTDFPPLTGLVMSLDVSATGDPFVDGELVFTFDGVDVVVVPVEIQRIVLWGLEPELPFVESLGFLTAIKTAVNGNEQRSSPRRYPRQAWAYEYLIEEGRTAQVLDNLLFDYQGRTFGVPVWFEDTKTTAALTAGDTVLPVVETAWRDFRVGGLVVVLTSQDVFDVLELVTVNPTSLEVASPLVNDYAAGSLVFPLATCTAQPMISGERWPVGLRRRSIRFESTNNAVDLADLSPFSTYNGKLLLDLGNSLNNRRTVGQAFRQRLVLLDGGAGNVFQEPLWDRHKGGYQLTVRAEGRQAVWELRGLVHALRGRRVSFYAPTYSDDLVVVANLLNASNTMDVENYGYAQFVRSRQPRNVIRVSFVDGSPPLLREITDAAAIDADTEQLTVDTNWPATITPAEISRVEFVEKLRLETDDPQLEYDASGHRARLVAPVVVVFE